MINMIGFPIRKSADQFVCANPRSLSQLITSFIASQSQGIHHTPLLSFFTLYPIYIYVVMYVMLKNFKWRISESNR